MDNIIERAVELGNLLRESKLYREAQAAEEVYAADEAAQQAVAAYNEKRLSYAKKIHGEKLSKEEAQPLLDELERDFAEVRKFPAVDDYIEKKKKFDELLKNTVSVIEYAVRGNEGGGCDKSHCDTCGGCR